VTHSNILFPKQFQRDLEQSSLTFRGITAPVAAWIGACQSISNITSLPANKADQMSPGVITQHNPHTQNSKLGQKKYNACQPGVWQAKQAFLKCARNDVSV
jgi:hypothetical protein